MAALQQLQLPLYNVLVILCTRVKLSLFRKCSQASNEAVDKFIISSLAVSYF